MGMESTAEIMARMGFRKDSSAAVKIAFIKNLIKQTCGVDVRTPLKIQPDMKIETQLSFDFDSNLKVG